TPGTCRSRSISSRRIPPRDSRMPHRVGPRCQGGLPPARPPTRHSPRTAIGPASTAIAHPPVRAADGRAATLSIHSGPELALDVWNQSVDRVLVRDLLDGRVVFDLRDVGERQPRLELLDALAGELAVGDPFGVGRQVLGEQLAARDLDPEVALEAEDDVQEI